MNMLIIIYAFLLFVLLYIYLINKLNYWKRRKVFSYRLYPIFGNFLEILIGRDEFWSTIRKIYGEVGGDCPYFGFYIFHKPILVIKDKNIIKQILIKDFNLFSNRTNHSNEKVDPLMSNTLFVLNFDIWRRSRRMLTPMLSTGKMKQMISWIQGEDIDMKNYSNSTSEKCVNIKKIVKSFVYDTLLLFIFGRNSEFFQSVKSVQGDEEVLKQTSLIRKVATFSWVFLPSLVDIFSLSFLNLKSGYDFVKFYLRAEEERKNANYKRGDLLDLMIKLSGDENETEFSDIRRTAHVVSFFGNGVDSITFGISLCLYELALHPEVQNKLRDEIYENLNGEGNVSYETISKMDYLDLVVKETLRLHPVLPFVTRYANANYIIKSTGLIVEKGIQILVPVEAMHKDPLFFEEPLKFKPERFRGKKIQENLRYIYMPFGEGPRKCIAERMSWLVIKYGVISFLKDFEVSLPEGFELKFEENAIFATPKGGRLDLKMKKINVS